MLLEAKSRVVPSDFAYPAPQTLLDAIDAHAAQTPHAPAFIFDDLTELNYGVLRERIDLIGDTLHRAGLGASHRVAVVMPQGPMLAMTVVAIACHATFIALCHCSGRR